MADETNQGAGTAGSGALDKTTETMNKLIEDNSKLSQQLGELATMVSTIAQSRQQQSAPATSSQSSDEELENLAYRDPKAYAARVRAEAKAEAARLVDERLSQQSNSNAILSQLGSEYPELNEANSELTLRAVDIYKKMSPQDRQSPLAYKAAVRDAAADLGILPKNKRKATSSSETPDISSGSSGSGSTGSGSSQKSKKLDANTLAFAQLLGLNTKDPKVVESITKRAQRTSWKKYE